MTPSLSSQASAATSTVASELTDGAKPSAPPGQAFPSPPASTGGRFARLLLLAGKGFIPIGLFARLPLAMLTVGALTLVTAVTGSYAVGGAAAGAVGIGSALGAPVLGAWADRLGQRPVLLFAAVFNTAAVVALILMAYLVPAGQDVAAALPVLAAAFVAGASCPQVGPLARVRWMALTARSQSGHAEDLDAALSYESTADELTFVLGPALVGILASLIAPWLPLAVAASLTLTLVPAFAVHRTHLAVPLSVRRRRRGTPAVADPAAPRDAVATNADSSAGSRKTDSRGMAAVALPFLAMLCMGTFFGSTQTGLSSFSASFATAEIAGLLYAVMGLSSAAAALSVAYWSKRFTFPARWMVSAMLMAGLAVLLLLPESALPMVLVLLVLGLPVGPLMVTVFAIGGEVAPAGRLGTVMTALASGIVAGTALGSSVAGQLAQHHGYSAAFLVPVCAAAALFLLGAAAAVVLRKGRASRRGNRTGSR
ncbi:MFS family permease [Arthrobacter sp. PvP102]|uniref:MFS transporter n=1 Tax=unclassified Arthrobacter TaxID=235627 RepID=UPI001AE85427|nr:MULTISPECIES: MFS transporter [unclassified Arthrobacter]MBP1231880.1 MFS family permease [Arthrobacter sp. PvP103]MBP1237015.1 MFS family permease [Arthrobacter sp. PvP102]